MKFKIINLNIDEIVKTSFFKVDYTIESDKNELVNIRASIYDPFFNIEYIPGSIDVSVKTNVNLWVGFDVDNLANDEKPNFKFGFRLLIEDLDNNKVLHNKTYRTTFEYNKEGKTVWIFGDSHVWESFGGYTHNPIKISGFKSMRASVTSLSLNKFVNGNYLSFVNAHSVKPDDCMVFYLGEIDFRIAIHKHCSNKSKELAQVCLDLMNDYYKAINNIKRVYNNRIIIMAPNPPIRDNYLSNDWVWGTEKERILCWDIFDNFWKNKDIEYLDWTDDYKLDDKLIDSNKLMKRNGVDFHILDYQYCIKSLSKKLNNKKVIIKLMGGLGNQMFQYAFGKFISDETGRELILDTSFLERRDMPPGFVYRNYDLDVFNLDTKLISGFNEPFELIIQDWNHLHKIEPELIKRSLTSDSDNIYIDGYWQSPKYFGNKSDYFKNFKYPIKKESLELMHDIINSNSIMINIRRTDFVDNDFSGCFGRDYIDKSLLNFKEIDYKIFIFSDDIEWCEENLSDLGTIVSHDHKGYKFSNYLQLMSLCKFFIIPNSSFAWWSAYLSNSSKMVCYPENWILNYHKKIEDLFPENWTKIK
jgi:hypothetical protein